MRIAAPDVRRGSGAREGRGATDVAMAGFADGRLVRVRLACKTEHVSIDWDGTYADLAREFAEAFVADTNAPRGLELLDEDEECRARAKRAFRLRDRTTGMFHENFDPSDVCRHDVVTVNYESFHLAMAALARRCVLYTGPHTTAFAW